MPWYQYAFALGMPIAFSVGIIFFALKKILYFRDIIKQADQQEELYPGIGAEARKQHNPPLFMLYGHLCPAFMFLCSNLIDLCHEFFDSNALLIVGQSCHILGLCGMVVVLYDFVTQFCPFLKDMSESDSKRKIEKIVSFNKGLPYALTICALCSFVVLMVFKKTQTSLLIIFPILMAASICSAYISYFFFKKQKNMMFRNEKLISQCQRMIVISSIIPLIGIVSMLCMLLNFALPSLLQIMLPTSLTVALMAATGSVLSTIDTNCSSGIKVKARVTQKNNDNDEGSFKNSVISVKESSGFFDALVSQIQGNCIAQNQQSNPAQSSASFLEYLKKWFSFGYENNKKTHHGESFDQQREEAEKIRF